MRHVELAQGICRVTGFLCLEGLPGDAAGVIAAVELAIYETTLALVEAGGVELAKSCFLDEDCLRSLVDSSLEAADLTERSVYHHSLTPGDAGRAIKVLLEIVEELQSAGKERGQPSPG